MGVKKLEFCQLHMATKDALLLFLNYWVLFFFAPLPPPSSLPPPAIITAKPNPSKNVVHSFLPPLPLWWLGIIEKNKVQNNNNNNNINTMNEWMNDVHNTWMTFCWVMHALLDKGTMQSTWVYDICNLNAMSLDLMGQKNRWFSNTPISYIHLTILEQIIKTLDSIKL